MRGTSETSGNQAAPFRQATGEAPISTGKSGGIGRRLVCILLILAVTTLLGTEIAWAEPAAITQAKSEAEALQERIDELEEQLDAAVEEYNYSKAKLAETKAAAAKTQAVLTKAERDLELARTQLSDRVVQIYKQGRLSLLNTLADSTSFTDLVNRLDLLERLSAQDAQLIADVQSFRDEVSQRKVELTAQLEEEKVLAAEADAAKDAVATRLAANEKELEGKEALIAKLQKEEAIRQARLAAAAKAAAEKAKAEAAAKAKAAAAEKAKAATKSNNSGGSSKVSVTVPDSASTSDVVSIAMQYLGSKYVWAGASPSGFDCSGFVMYVYKKVGVSLPHSSRMQISCGQSVSKSELRAGDLVFFGNPTIHHVGIYIGDGKMIHAAGVGKGVRIDSVWRSNYHGACRLIL